MKLSSFSSYVLLSLLPFTLAHPGMGDSMRDIRRAAAQIERRNSKELIGDLKTLKDSQLTAIGKDIKAILLESKSAESSVIDTSIPPGTVDSAACKADLCCVWKWISYEMTAKFNGTSGRCTKFARGAVRLGFHDAGVWSKTSTYGGADGSILLTNELDRADNNGLKDIADYTKQLYNKYNKYGVSMADLIQMGANIATVVCPLGPRIRSFVGRKDNAKAGPTGLLPGETDSADKLIKLFADKTIDAHDLVALVGAHSTSQQHFVDKARDGDPQDSTPGIWDVAFYGETTTAAPPRVLKFQSDINLSKDSRTKSEWQAFINGQGHWNADYSTSYTRLSLLGVNNINDLKECTKVLPPARKSFVSQDQAVLDLWLQGQFDQLNNMVDDAIMLTGVITTPPKVTMT
ncbi:class II peroxidase [Aaosphaeria arxii CBS 175.79]|uniref:Peroxidase n=1 Tax=Aaosphaeria arxii CBS 175.79 TaxID=1450172 RepID=A0A6A5Y3S7_9PLEO|nr:class II peroxidase [Aaosphaeria arxii CBS 175.79]KAF2019204.1 class II peroxidase [Aaosphaeria arxii CBS 175.79]